MAHEIKLPDIGEGVSEGEIVKWLVKEGDTVTEDQPLVEIMTDKATVTIPSPKSGKIVKRHGAEGSIAKVHEPLVDMELAGAAPAAPAAKAEAPKAEAPKAAAKPAAPAAPAPAAKASAPEPKGSYGSAPVPQQPAPQQPAPARGADEKVLATPVTRRIARENEVDLRNVPGTGPQGRVMKKDVLAALESGGARAEAPSAPSAPSPVVPPPSPAAAAQDERVVIRGLRKAIFKKMVQSEQYAVPFTYVDEVDMTELGALRTRVNRKLAAAGGGRLTFLPFITKALLAALRKFPHLNALMDEEKQELIVRRSYNIGIGVATDAGLTVAVVHDADKRSLRHIGEEIERLAKAGRDNKLTMPELSGSTFTITSLGKDGGMFATPVINHPEVAILGIHKIEPRPVVIEQDGERQIVIRERMYMSCSFDHRVIDGHVGAAFVGEIKRLLEDPDALLLELT